MCPHPPLLVPEVAPGTAEELTALRDACAAAVRALITVQPGRVVVIGAGPPAADLDESAGGTLAAFGVDAPAGGSGRQLPLSLTIGAWLLDRAGWTGPRTYSTGTPDIEGDDVVVLAMADGTTRRSVKAPGFLDERAEPFDRAIAKALADGDPEGLAALDADLAAELGATGVPTLHTLAQLTKGADATAHVRFDDAPFGVGYVVADWVVQG